MVVTLWKKGSASIRPVPERPEGWSAAVDMAATPVYTGREKVRRIMKLCLLFSFAVALAIALSAVAPAETKQVMGWLERARLLPENLLVRAKLDTGADNSSLSASNVEQFDRNGETWVRFSVTGPSGESTTFERQVIRTAKIKRHGEARQERPVVRMAICVGSAYREAEVNLVDRTGFKCQLLVGRSFMSGEMVVDPALEYATEPECEQAERP
jgi:hypothetical protein